MLGVIPEKLAGGTSQGGRWDEAAGAGAQAGEELQRPGRSALLPRRSPRERARRLANAIAEDMQMCGSPVACRHCW